MKGPVACFLRRNFSVGETPLEQTQDFLSVLKTFILFHVCSQIFVIAIDNEDATAMT